MPSHSAVSDCRSASPANGDASAPRGAGEVLQHAAGVANGRGIGMRANEYPERGTARRDPAQGVGFGARIAGESFNVNQQRTGVGSHPRDDGRRDSSARDGEPPLASAPSLPHDLSTAPIASPS